MKESSEKRLKACIKGNRKAQQALYEEYKNAMFAVCLRYGKSREDAEDMLQDGFIKVFRDLHQYKPIAPLGAWIRKVMVNTALEHVRSAKRKIVTHAYDGLVLNQSGEQESELDARHLTLIIQSLGDEYRLVFNMFAIEGYSHAEIAEKLEISESNSKVRLTRARKMIQEMLEKLFETKY